MKHKYIESLLSEIELLASKVENLKESKRVPFSFFKESFKRTQEISRLLHELEFVQIEEMRGEMEKLVQYLSDTEKTKKEAEAEAEYLAAKVKQVEVEFEIEKEKWKEKKEEIVEINDVSKEAETVEKVETEEEPLVAKEDQEVSLPIAENKEEEQQEKKEAKLAPTENKFIEESLEAALSSTPSLSRRSEKVLADIVPKNKSLNDIQPVSHTLQDSKTTISLNDRFLFQRELFNNNRDAMNTMLTKLQAFSSFDLVESYLKRNTTWNFSDETVGKFLQMLKDRF